LWSLTGDRGDDPLALLGISRRLGLDRQSRDTEAGIAPAPILLRRQKEFNEARALGLREDEFNSCLDEGKYAKTVSENVAAGSAVGVTGTPSFFIGKTSADGTILGTRIIGAQPIAAFRQVIDQHLDGKM